MMFELVIIIIGIILVLIGNFIELIALLKWYIKTKKPGRKKKNEKM